MINKLKTTPNKAVQTFITYGNKDGNRQAKIERLDQLEEVLVRGFFYEHYLYSFYTKSINT